MRNWTILLLTMFGLALSAESLAAPEVRGTWMTTTANEHIASPEKTAESMRRLKEIGLNTVYVETWKNGYTQYPSAALENLIGVDRRPALVKQDPGDADSPVSARDLLQETLIEAHRNELIYIGWFEYGFMAAHQSTMNHLRQVKPDWISRDQSGNEVAPNGFVWLNPLHPQARRFLLDIVLEAIDRYDMDGVQLDDRIVWPYVTMGYDDYTVAAYRNEHGGNPPPEDPRDPEWIEWRSGKIDEYAEQFVAEVRAARPGLLVSVSPAPYPWVYENYCLDWPTWAGQGLWDEYIPQCYRYDYPAFEATWDQQVGHLKRVGGRATPKHMLAGILTTGSKPDPVPWGDLEKSVQHVRATKGGGHVWWFSRGVLDEYPDEITNLYQGDASHNPRFRKDWRPTPVQLQGDGDGWESQGSVRKGTYRVIGKSGGAWNVLGTLDHAGGAVRIPAELKTDSENGRFRAIPGHHRGEKLEAVELLVDRRGESSRGVR